jgi:Mn-dependent DtxR family transcriptional regulator
LRKKDINPQYSSVQYKRIILYAIHFHKAAGISEIARKLNTSHAHAYSAIERMREEGLVNYHRGSKYLIIDITDEGLELLKSNPTQTKS